jgi:hypothetical protein
MSWFSNMFGKTPPPTPVEPLVPIATVPLPPKDEDAVLYQDQILRKNWSESVLQDYGIPILKSLPPIESGTVTKPRTPREIADRLLALVIVAVKGEGLEQELVLGFLEDHNVRELLSPKERAFIDDLEPSEQDRIQFTWRYEAAWVMIWALQLADSQLGYPNDICNPGLVVQTARDTVDLTERGVQATNNLLNEADLIYRFHWAVRQAHIEGKSPPGGLDAGVIQERHHALNWLIGYNDAAWDDVSTPT